MASGGIIVTPCHKQSPAKPAIIVPTILTLNMSRKIVLHKTMSGVTLKTRWWTAKKIQIRIINREESPENPHSSSESANIQVT
ncbi:unnamed protein product [Danaus chrysippus]|uniref:(African queen) hypothetical protein n=1 Tax=Danaus chrysippus TaxID=151541 RepID=A0A8J2R0X0_9NEOP|nr:unnamed protein product [Danaus chrysippus]